MGCTGLRPMHCDSQTSRKHYPVWGRSPSSYLLRDSMQQATSTLRHNLMWPCVGICNSTFKMAKKLVQLCCVQRSCPSISGTGPSIKGTSVGTVPPTFQQALHGDWVFWFVNRIKIYTPTIGRMFQAGCFGRLPDKWATILVSVVHPWY